MARPQSLAAPKFKQTLCPEKRIVNGGAVASGGGVC